MTAQEIPVPLTLVVGDEQVLAERAVTQAVRAVRLFDPDTVVHDVDAGQLGPGDLDELLAPSLFGGRQVVVVRAAQDASKETAADLASFVADPPDGYHLVLVHVGAVKGKALLTAMSKAAQRRVDTPKGKPGDRAGQVRKEFRDAGRRIDETALRLLLETVGSDLRALFAASSQLMADTPGAITEEAVSAYYRGRAETSGFAVAELAVMGNLSGALELARAARNSGVADVLLSSALAGTLRTIGQVAGSGSTADAAVRLGLPPWKVEKARRQSNGWTPAGLTRAVFAAARLDADVKGGSTDPAYAVERALVEVVRARQTRADPAVRFEAFGRVGR